MKRNLLHAVQSNTSPISEAEFKGFLLKRHGVTPKDNASSDPLALDYTGLSVLKPTLPTHIVRYVFKEFKPKKNSGVSVKIEGLNGRKKPTLPALNLKNQKKKTESY
ncbi:MULTISPECIES: hypothetical protein [unclassified Duganella]|uniref:hypothetical protein n=1 Tax=unclassified Duganella TaxID=2636909 RepID=UPI0011C0E523|nr:MULTISPECIES: hypothetical protein [unclassified Duganella]